MRLWPTKNVPLTVREPRLQAAKKKAFALFNEEGFCAVNGIEQKHAKTSLFPSSKTPLHASIFTY